MQVADEPVFVEPSHLLACEETLQPRYAPLGDDEARARGAGPGGPRHGGALGREQAPAAHREARRCRCPCPPRPSIMWTGDLTPTWSRTREVYAVVLRLGGRPGALLRLEGTGRILVEQAAGLGAPAPLP